MIAVSLDRGRDARLLTLRGHATGEPAVCAAASAIVYALAGWMKREGIPGLRFQLSGGDAWLLCRGGTLADAALGIALEGLGQLAQSYPECVRVETRDVNALQSDDIEARGEERGSPALRETARP